MNQSLAYQQCLDWLFSRFPAYQNLGAAAYKPGLARVNELLALLQINAHQIPSIHIAGTNGKGSTAAYCASLLSEKGLKVGLFTSPHIYDFSERIRVNGDPIDQQSVIDFCARFQQLHSNIEASFFELTFAMALTYFNDQTCDYIVIETGLGGRLDATNILAPKVSVITNISLDHQDLLGDSIEQIAQEKAGIIKQHTPVVIGQKTPTTHAIFLAQSRKLTAPIYFCDDAHFSLDELPLIGYQKKNFQTALIALSKMGLECSEQLQLSALQNLYSNTGFFGRLQTVHNKPKTIIDVSHNPAGVSETLPIIKQLCKGQLFIIYGASKDKDALEILKLFPKDAKIAACLFSNPRSKNREEWSALGIATIYDHIDAAIETIQKQMKSQDLLWVTGSFFLISDLSTKKKIF